MDKPTLQEVKERFKNAKEVRDLWSREVVDISDWKFYFDNECDDYWVEKYKNSKDQVELYDKGEYAEIISYKEPLYQLTAKEVVHAYENPQWLKDTFKECFETELEVGKWYKSDYKNGLKNKSIYCVTGIYGNNFGAYGFNWEGKWSVNKYDYGTINKDYQTPSTEKEVEEALVKEAIKRGYKKGVKVKTDWFGEEEINILNGGSFNLNNNAFGFNTLCNNGSPWIFKNGIWAEIIQVPTYTIPEAKKTFNIKIIKAV